jgi:hypothetical protein
MEDFLNTVLGRSLFLLAGIAILTLIARTVARDARRGANLQSWSL